MLELFFTAAWKVLLAGLVLGAGLPAVFALGIRFSAAGAGATEVPVTSGRAGYRSSGWRASWSWPALSSSASR